MSDFFKQFLVQLNDIWSRFNTLQKVIVSGAFALTFIGLIVSISVNSFGGSDSGKATLFANMNLDEAATVTAYLKEQGHSYSIESDGRTILVPKENLHEVRMDLARNGLPESGGQGYELFDKNQLGLTDFVQNLNYRRAIEGELRRSVETLKEVDNARIHISIPKETIFMDTKEDATASVIVKIHPGERLTDKKVIGITHLVASAVEGLKSRQVTILDHRGNMLTQGFAEDAIAERTNHNMTLQQSVENHLERKVVTILEGVLGPNRAKVKVDAKLDFDQIQKQVESYDPKKKVVRSEQRDDGTRKNSPATGDEVTEGSITNYEIDRTVAEIVSSPGERKRITVSVAVDGTYEIVDGKKNYVPRAEEELAVLTRLVKTAVGYDETKTDEVYVASMQFDNSHVEFELLELEKLEQQEWIRKSLHWGLIALILIMGFVALRKVLKDVVVAMNPPLPRYAGIDLEVEDEEVSEDVRRQNDLLDRMESVTRESPDSVAELIRTWLQDTSGGKKKGAA
jgi:flagellar M-ring protein FliF